MIVKKWWVVALVFTLALSLTSCSSKRATKNLSGQGAVCDGQNWGFNVKLQAMGGSGQYSVYQVILEPAYVSINQPFAQVAVAAGTNISVKVSSVVLSQNIPITFQMSLSELYSYDTLIIAPQNTGNNILQEDINASAVCDLPLPPVSGSQSY